jgi:N-acetyl-gamma-glutamyl-phosphate reductase
VIRPLLQAGIIAPDHPVTVNAVSGYSGGGKGMIAEFEKGESAPFFVYGTAQTHKHLPELQKYTGLTRAPMFVPSVGNFEQGMIVQVPLHLAPGDLARARAALHAAYDGSGFVQVVERAQLGERIDPQQCNDTNLLKVCVDGDDTTGRALMIAVLDNLGKGASGAAVQNLNIMLGLDEGLGL